jgi:hypothetical protein
MKIHQGRFGHFQSSTLLLPSEDSAKANRSIDFIIDRSNHQSKKNLSCGKRSIETRQARMRSIDFIIDRSNLDIFGTIWNNVDMSLFLDILNILDISRYFLDIFRYFLDIFRYFQNVLDISKYLLSYLILSYPILSYLFFRYYFVNLFLYK